MSQKPESLFLFVLKRSRTNRFNRLRATALPAFLDIVNPNRLLFLSFLLNWAIKQSEYVFLPVFLNRANSTCFNSRSFFEKPKSINRTSSCNKTFAFIRLLSTTPLFTSNSFSLRPVFFRTIKRLNRKPFSSPRSPPLNYIPPLFCRHPFSEPMSPCAFHTTRLICAFHNQTPSLSLIIFNTQKQPFIYSAGKTKSQVIKNTQ